MAILTAVTVLGDLLLIPHGGRDSLLRGEALRWASTMERPVKRARAFTKGVVAASERAVVDKGQTNTVRVLCGTIRIMVGASLR